MKKPAALLVGVVALLVGVVSPASAATTTISARAKETPWAQCGDTMHIIGTVTPHGATPRVVLQKTVGGKWKDAVWYSSWQAAASATPKKTLRAGAVNPSTGTYTITYYVPSYATMHFRVRSNGGSVVSPSFYVKVLTSESCH